VRLNDGEYYEDHKVAHVVQGDVFKDVPFAYAAAVRSTAPRGQRKRFWLPGEPDFIVPPPTTGYAIVCNYTCGIVAQPPGTPGYSHANRLVAPIMHLRTLAEIGFAKKELRRVHEDGGVVGLMYLPWPERDTANDEWKGHAAACLFRPAAVDQELLDSRTRVKRLSERAQRELIARLVQTVAPFLPDPEDAGFVPPDRSDSWA
jgi:hypothetical protein